MWRLPILGMALRDGSVKVTDKDKREDKRKKSADDIRECPGCLAMHNVSECARNNASCCDCCDAILGRYP
jgi:hypothetical protein